jgi:alkylation response protein AidB-like acyl-CoA dehydrogenase
MNFELNEDQRQLSDALETFLARQFPFDRLKALKRSGHGNDPAVWRGLVELGVPALLVPAHAGGLGFGPVETLALMQACGPYLLLEPVLASAVLATALLGELADETPAAQLLEELASGARIATLAHFEPESRFELDVVATRARADGNGWRLGGRKSFVLQAGIADVLLVSARLDAAGSLDAAGPLDAAGSLALFCVPRDTEGVAVIEYPLIDGQRAADVVLAEVRVPASARLGASDRVQPALESAVAQAIAALCAEAVSIMQAVLGATVTYLQTRQQFGQPIGRFQALQHRVADMRVQLEQARSMSVLATLNCRNADRAARARALSGAKALVGEASRFIGQQAVQLHGGMGMTDEMQVSHWFKRLTAIDLWLGDSDTHLARYMALLKGEEAGGV